MGGLYYLRQMRETAGSVLEGVGNDISWNEAMQEIINAVNAIPDDRQADGLARVWKDVVRSRVNLFPTSGTNGADHNVIIQIIYGIGKTAHTLVQLLDACGIRSDTDCFKSQYTSKRLAGPWKDVDTKELIELQDETKEVMHAHNIPICERTPTNMKVFLNANKLSAVVLDYNYGHGKHPEGFAIGEIVNFQRDDTTQFCETIGKHQIPIRKVWSSGGEFQIENVGFRQRNMSDVAPTLALELMEKLRNSLVVTFRT